MNKRLIEKELLLTIEKLKELFLYSTETGLFYWRASKHGVKNGMPAGCIRCGGYVGIRLFGKNYLAHRMAWAYTYGEWPSDQIDHINREKTDNRISNLRVVTSGENRQNIASLSTNKSGFKGVHFDKTRGKWMASISFKYYRKNIGRFDSAEDAYAAYSKAASDLHQFNTVNG